MEKPKLLVVEDDPLLADLIEAILVDEGYDVVGPVDREADAFHVLAEERVQGAVLDFRLNGGTAARIAWMLRERSIPLVVFTGAPAEAEPCLPPGTPIIAKPRIEDLPPTLSQVVPSDP